MVSYIDLMKQEGLDSPHAPEYLEILDEKTQRLRVLTEELFEAAKASSGDMPVRMEAIDLGSLISQSLGEMNERLAARKLEILVSNHCAQSTPVMNTAWNRRQAVRQGRECAEGNVNVAPFDAASFDAADGMTEGMRAGVQAAAAGGMDDAAVFDDGAAAGIASAYRGSWRTGSSCGAFSKISSATSAICAAGQPRYLDIRRVNRKRSSAAGGQPERRLLLETEKPRKPSELQHLRRLLKPQPPESQKLSEARHPRGQQPMSETLRLPALLQQIPPVPRKRRRRRTALFFWKSRIFLRNS